MEKARILVVEDDEQVRSSLTQMLINNGFQVSNAENGEAALRKLGEGDYELILTDIVMEGMDGIQLLEEAKILKPAIPVILITGYGSVDSVIEALQKDAIDYILKPFEDEELLKRIARVLDRQQMGKQAARAKAYERVAMTLGTVAHELNNPLMIISLNTELILSEMNHDHPHYEMVQSIQQAADRMAEIIRRMREIKEFKTKPYTKQSEIYDLSEGARAEAGRKNRILVIDDERLMRESLINSLEKHEYSVSAASGGWEALEKLKNETFEYLLLDLSMPDLDGYETLLKIKELFCGHEERMPKVVMMTGYDASSITKKCLDEGASSVIQKPMKSKDVIAILDALR